MTNVMDGKEDLYLTILSELKALGVKVPKIKKFRSSVARQDSLPPVQKCRVFGVSLKEQEWISEGDYPLPKFVSVVTTYLQKFISKEIGLFRKAGNFARQRRLRDKIEEGQEIEEADPHDMASLLKQWMRELPEPLVPVWLQNLFVRCQALTDEENRIAACLLTFLLLPPDHLHTLKHLLKFLASIAVNIDKNRMGTNNLALIIAPNIFINKEPMDKTKNNLIYTHTAIVRTLIEHCDKVGEVPPSLTITKPLLGSELHSSTDLLDGNSNKSKKKSKSGSVQDIFSGLMKLVGQNPSLSAKTSDAVSASRHTISLDELDNAFESPIDKVTVKPEKSEKHVRRKSFGAILRKKKKAIKQILISEENNDALKKNKEDINHNFNLNMNDLSPSFTETKFQFNNLALNVATESQEKDNVNLISNSKDIWPKLLSESPTEPENKTRIHYSKSCLWQKNKSGASHSSLLSLPGVEKELKKTEEKHEQSFRSTLSRKQAFSIKPTQNVSSESIDCYAVGNSENREARPKKNGSSKSKSLHRVCSHSQTSLCNLKCDKNKPIIEKRPSERSMQRNNQSKSMSVIKLDEIETLPEKSACRSKERSASKKSRSPRQSRRLPKSSSRSPRESAHNVINPSPSMPALSNVTDLSKDSRPKGLDLELSLLLQNFCVSPPHDSPEIHVRVDISSAKPCSELNANISKNRKVSKEDVSTNKLGKIDELNMFEAPKTRKRLSSKSDSRIPRLKKPEPSRPNSFSGKSSGRRNSMLEERNVETPRKQSTRVPVMLIEDEKSQMVPIKELEESLSCFKTPSTSFESPEPVIWQDGSQYLSAVSSPDSESSCKRESIARILQEQPGHVQAKVSLYDNKVTSSSSSTSSINKSEPLKGGKLLRVCSEKFPSSCRSNRPGLPTSTRYDVASRSHSVKLDCFNQRYIPRQSTKLSHLSISPKMRVLSKEDSISPLVSLYGKAKMPSSTTFRSAEETRSTSRSCVGTTSERSFQSGEDKKETSGRGTSNGEDDVFIDISP